MCLLQNLERGGVCCGALLRGEEAGEHEGAPAPRDDRRRGGPLQHQAPHPSQNNYQIYALFFFKNDLQISLRCHS